MVLAELQPSTITMCSLLTTQINADVLSKILPVKIIYNEDGEQIIKKPIGKKKPKIGFYDLEGVIITVRYGDISRGMRQGGKQLQNVIGIDLQIGNKNVNLKLSKKTLQLTGAKSQEMGELAFTYICDIVNGVQSRINTLNKMTQKNLDKCLSVVINEYIDNTNEDVTLLEKEEVYSIFFSKFSSDEEKDKFIEKTTKKYLQTVNYLRDFLHEDINNFLRFVRCIRQRPNIIPSGEKVSFNNVNIVNLLVMSKIECEKTIPTLKLIAALSGEYSLKKRTNQGSRFEIFVQSKSKPTKHHKLTIHSKGSIRQNSQTSIEEAYDVYFEVVTKIEKILRDLGFDVLN